jgi:hypothetical protein
MPKLSRSDASFKIGVDLFTNPPGVMPDASFVTRSLGIQPTHAHDAGAPQEHSSRGGLWKHGQWRLESPLPEESDLEAHLAWLLQRLLPVRDRVLEVLESDHRLQANFFCGLWLENSNEGLGLTPQTLQGIGSLRAELILDIYYEGARAQTDNATLPRADWGGQPPPPR